MLINRWHQNATKLLKREKGKKVMTVNLVVKKKKNLDNFSSWVGYNDVCGYLGRGISAFNKGSHETNFSDLGVSAFFECVVIFFFRRVLFGFGIQFWSQGHRAHTFHSLESLPQQHRFSFLSSSLTYTNFWLLTNSNVEQKIFYLSAIKCWYPSWDFGGSYWR